MFEVHWYGALQTDNNSYKELGKRLNGKRKIHIFIEKQSKTNTT